jgi:hypothetical protein
MPLLAAANTASGTALVVDVAATLRSACRVRDCTDDCARAGKNAAMAATVARAKLRIMIESLVAKG